MIPIDPSDPANQGMSVTWRVENGSALRIYVSKADMPSAFPVGAAVILNSTVYPQYSGEYVVGSVIDFNPSLWAVLTTCIGTELKQEF